MRRTTAISKRIGKKVGIDPLVIATILGALIQLLALCSDEDPVEAAINNPNRLKTRVFREYRKTGQPWGLRMQVYNAIREELMNNPAYAREAIKEHK